MNKQIYEFYKYPSFDIDILFDRLEAAEVTEESPFGITVMNFSVDEFNLLKAAFGRNNGYSITRYIDRVPVTSIDDDSFRPSMYKMKRPSLLTRLKNAWRSLNE